MEPETPTDFTELVVPELRRRGLFRTAYTGTTLRSTSASTGRPPPTPDDRPERPAGGHFAVESPVDGAARVAATWQPGPGTRGHQAPAVYGGIRRTESREQLRRYAATAPDSPMRDWARTIADLPDLPG